MRHVGTVIVGAGQAGLALSHELTRLGRDHVVLERGRVGERWRTERWDSLALLTPNWLSRLPGTPAHPDGDGFLARDELVSHLERYARSFGAPVAEATAVLAVSRAGGGATGAASPRRLLVETSRGGWCAQNAVVASGACDVPVIPSCAASAPTASLHASAYRNPSALPGGTVMVVGAGPSGQQIALELRRAGREVVLSAGRHVRMPRRYRGRDAFAWLDAIGQLATTIDEMPDAAAARRAPSFPLDGRGGGEDLDLGVLARAGVRLTGRLTGFRGPRALFADDLVENARAADQTMRKLLARIDAIADGPAEEVADVAVEPGPGSLDLVAEGIGSIVWATGYRRLYPWLHLDVLDGDGEIAHRRGVTEEPGVYAIGLRFLHRRDSHFIGGVGRDATYIAEHIAARARQTGEVGLAAAA
jgi:putative flavoprotein involved in K+ transport